ncbi:hypothetical protein BT96DRAFT_1014926 [Gymnopus androsaceus JB14]|uniref:H15 domain-containing protein n=1 Tax=Gymnopus androsaceus JB14 TaxID=1447944 RepID=A0A6A4I762_9AGAR|nr:hypothetical protein BT96DRAFT_1014926 [Gymnopus androsaceus JB14]
MQAGSSSATFTSHLQQPNDHDRKRRYLSLLPPPQVIELCLNFEIHVPASAKTLLWPTDLDAAIAALQKASDGKVAYLAADSNPKPQIPPKPPNISVNAPGPPRTDRSLDPEGLAPKDLYTWMASHYPVQANFRPSASQALQKAYKRGRFEKSLSGKYRLNSSWTGGNTTRRTTRRPQTHSTHSAASLPPLSSRYVNKTSTSFSQPNELGDAYEAAQHILKALNFSGPSGAGLDATMTVEGVRGQLQAQLALLAAQLSEIATLPDSEPAATIVPVQSNVPDTSATPSPSLATILADVLASDGSTSSGTSTAPVVPPTPQPPPQSLEVSIKQEEQVVVLSPPPPSISDVPISSNDAGDSDDEEMDEVVV